MIGLVKNYSDMLNRIAIAAFMVSAFVAYLLMPPSSSTAMLIESLKLPIPSEFFGFKGIATIYLAAGILGAMLSRLLLLHNLISNIFGIRKRFDRDHVLRPMAKRVGITCSAESLKGIDVNRRVLMRRAFYAYADPHKPSINAHLIQTALDSWSWYWIFVESIFFCSIGWLAAAAIGNWLLFGVLFIVTISILLVLALSYPKRRAMAAQAQVDEILIDAGREKTIVEAFRLCGIK